MDRHQGWLRVNITYAGNIRFPFSQLVRAAFPQIEVWPESGASAVALILDLEETFRITQSEDLDRETFTKFLDLLKRHIAIDDSLDESHALAPHSLPPEGEEWNRTSMGKLVKKAKSYYGEAAYKDKQAAKEICMLLLNFINSHPRYRRADILVPAPSSNPARTKTLSLALSKAISKRLEKRLVTPVRLKPIPPQKDYEEGTSGVPRSEVQKGTVDIAESMQGSHAIIIDDLYDSGETLKEVARACREAGAMSVLGLTVTKNATFTQGMDLTEWPWG